MEIAGGRQRGHACRSDAAGPWRRDRCAAVHVPLWRGRLAGFRGLPVRARSLLAGQGYRYPDGGVYTQWPPLFPTLLAAIGLVRRRSPGGSPVAQRSGVRPDHLLLRTAVPAMHDLQGSCACGNSGGPRIEPAAGLRRHGLVRACIHPAGDSVRAVHAGIPAPTEPVRSGAGLDPCGTRMSPEIHRRDAHPDGRRPDRTERVAGLSPAKAQVPGDLRGHLCDPDCPVVPPQSRAGRSARRRPSFPSGVRSRAGPGFRARGPNRDHMALSLDASRLGPDDRPGTRHGAGRQ